MAEELSVVLRRTNDNSGLGFSLLGTAGLPPIIYDIVENSPAAESGEVEAGDIILKVNETDVNRFSTKEGQWVSADYMGAEEEGKESESEIEQKTEEHLPVLYCTSHGCFYLSAKNITKWVSVNAIPFTMWLVRTVLPKMESFLPGSLFLQVSPMCNRIEFLDCFYGRNHMEICCMGQISGEPRTGVFTMKQGTIVLVYFNQLGTLPRSSPIFNIFGSAWSFSGVLPSWLLLTFVTVRQVFAVLRCLRLSEDPIRLILKRDPAIKEKVIHLLSAPHDSGEDNLTLDEMAGPQTNETGPLKPPPSNEDEFSEDGNIFKFNKSKTPRFEAFMMTGDLILNLSRTQQTSGIFPKHQKKVDSLRYYHKNHHRHEHHNSVPTSPNESDLGLRKNSLSSPPESPHNSDDKKSASCYTFQTGVRTSKSEDQLQFQKNSSLSTVDIDIDDDVTSSLNTLLDTRPDGDRMIADQCNTLLERLTTMQNDDKSSESLDFSSNKTVLRIDENSGHPENGKASKYSDMREKRKSGCGEDGKHRHSGSHERQQKNEHRRSGHIEKTDGKNSENKSHTNDCFKFSDSKAERGSPKSDRIVWSCNASHPNESPSHSNSGSNSGSEHNWCCGNGSTLSSSSSPQRSLSPASPTSVSSSIMSSNSSSFKKNQPEAEPKPSSNNQNSSVDPWNANATSDISASEAVSNISSPDYQEEITLDILSGRDLLMEISDPSDSDSTILVSDPLSGSQKKMNGDNNYVKSGKNKNKMKSNGKVNCDVANSDDHKIVIQVKGPEGANVTCLPNNTGSAENHTNEEIKEKEGCDEFPEDYINKSPQSGSDEESDIESLRSFHYSPKAVDLPSAERLAKRLYTLDGFKKSDVSRHLSKNNDFSRAVAEEYLKYFSFTRDALDTALRKFLKQFSLTGETQERERVLVHFSKRYLDCNPGSFNSQDAVHTLTCAIMLLNTDLHGQNINRKMTCEEFIDNLRDLNEGENFPRDVLKSLYQAIKNYPLEWALDDDDQLNSQLPTNDKVDSNSFYGNPFLGIPNLASAIEYKKGYVMRKCCVDPNGKKTPFGKRGWKMFYCTLLDLVLYLHKDERGFLKAQLTDNFHNAIRIHHSLATKAQDYNKKQHVFRLETAEQAVYLFQTSDSKELQSWIDTINFVSASYSSQPLAGGVGSENKFQRPLLPCSHTKLNLREQLADHEERVQKLELALEEHRRNPPDRSAKSLTVQNYKEKDAYLQYEIRRYKTYVYILRLRMPQYTDIGEANHVEDETAGSGSIIPPPVPDRRIPSSNRYSYRAAIYSGEVAMTGRGDHITPDIG